MKKILMAAVAATALISTPALADGENTTTDTETFNISASTPAKCNLESNEYDVTLAEYDITNDEGRARNNVGNRIAQALNALDIKAWCTGSSNDVVLSRSPLVHSTGGNETTDGFNRAVIYDIAMSITGATRSDGTTPLEGTSDGAGNGPGAGVGSGLTVSRFGPNGQGANVRFENEAGSTSEAITDGEATSEGARGAYSEDNSRLVAGDYSGTVTVTITPGL